MHWRTRVTLCVAGCIGGAFLLQHCGGSDDSSPPEPSHDAGGVDATCGSACVDSGGGDANTPDTSVPDTSTTDATMVDATMVDANMPDTNMPDTNVPDTNMPDTNMPDTNVPDTNMPDTNMPDTWVAPCSASNPCGGSLSCCNGKCVDTTLDPQNCGSCGNACTTSQFCTGTSCLDAIFMNVCGNASATIVQDGVTNDNNAGVVVSAAMKKCTVPQNVKIIAQDAGPIDPTGRPSTNVGNSFVAAGGSFFQLGIHYMEQQGYAPILVNDNGTSTSYIRASDATTVVSTLNTNLSPNHDFFVLEMMTEPISGTLVVSIQGLGGPGTAAAAWYFNNVVVIDLLADGGVDAGELAKSWVVYEWTDNMASPDGAPGSDDTFLLHGSGN
jgi:hypothetical protein